VKSSLNWIDGTIGTKYSKYSIAVNTECSDRICWWQFSGEQLGIFTSFRHRLPASLCDLPPSEGRLGVDKAVLFSHGHDHLGLGQFEFGRDLLALISVESAL
jgi:hypothetical protein